MVWRESGVGVDSSSQPRSTLNFSQNRDVRRMYQKFFQLTQRPFSATPDPHVVYNSPSMRVSLNALEQTLRQGEGIGLLTAPAGTGKTLLCKVLSERLANDPLPVLLLNSSYATRSALLQAILFELDREYARMSEQELRLALVACGRKLAETQTGIALIVDEAHLLGEHILEELRALTNFAYQSRPVFRVVLCGQLPLEDTLASRSLEALNQRLKCHVSLETLTRQESLEYLMTRVESSGGNLLEIFTESALELIVHAADGLPRCLNQLCDHACLLAAVAGNPQVEPSHVREALEDLQKLPLHWNTPLPTQDPITQLKGLAPVQPTSPVTSKDQTDDWDIDEQIEDAISSQIPPVPAPSPPAARTTGKTAVIEIGGDEPEEANVPVHSANHVDHADQEEALREQLHTPIAEPVTGSLDAETESELMSIEDELDDEFADLNHAAETAAEITAEAEELETEEELAAEIDEPEANRLPDIEPVNDRYATLDARRKGHLRERSPNGTAVQPAASRLAAEELTEEEYKIAQTVLEISSDVSAALAGNPDAIYPPEADLYDAMDSDAARHDLVDPHHGEVSGEAPRESSDYDQLYSDLRRKREE